MRERERERERERKRWSLLLEYTVKKVGQIEDCSVDFWCCTEMKIEMHKQTNKATCH